MKTNLSKFTCMFSDLPFDKKVDHFPTSQEMFDYLNNYVDIFGLRKHINFSCTVTKAYKSEYDSWVVEFQNQGAQNLDYETEKNIKLKADALVVASGIFAKPNVPEFVGIQGFKGKYIHSKDYKSNFKTENKVLVIGGSLSAPEIAADIIDSTQNENMVVIHSFKEPFWVLNRYLSHDTHKVPLDLKFYNRKFYSIKQQDKDISTANKNKYMQSLCEEQLCIESLKINTDDEEQSKYPFKITISDKYIQYVKSGRIIPIKGEIKEISDFSVTFQNNWKENEIDGIVCATGYKADVSFLDQSILEKIQYNESDQIQPLILYKSTVHPDIDNLFFVGMYKGPYFAVMEQQAIFASKMIQGQVSIDIKMCKQELRLEEDIREQVPRPQFPHPEYVKFADDVAKINGNLPTFDLLTKEKSLYCNLMEGPVIPQHYLLNYNYSEIQHIQALDAIKEVESVMMGEEKPSLEDFG